MLGSKNRDYKTSERSAARNLKLHFEIMERLQRDGMERLEASRVALEMMKCKQCKELGRYCPMHGKPPIGPF